MCCLGQSRSTPDFPAKSKLRYDPRVARPGLYLHEHGVFRVVCGLLSVLKILQIKEKVRKSIRVRLFGLPHGARGREHAGCLCA